MSTHRVSSRPRGRELAAPGASLASHKEQTSCPVNTTQRLTEPTVEKDKCCLILHVCESERYMLN